MIIATFASCGDNCQTWASRTRSYLLLLIALCKAALLAAIWLFNADRCISTVSAQVRSICSPLASHTKPKTRPTMHLQSNILRDPLLPRTLVFKAAAGRRRNTQPKARQKKHNNSSSIALTGRPTALRPTPKARNQDANCRVRMLTTKRPYPTSE